MKKVRVTVSLTPETYEILKRLKDLSGGTVSGHISTLLDEMRPALSMFLRNAEIIKNLDAKSKEEILAGVETIEGNLSLLAAQAENIVDETSEQLDLFQQVLKGKK